VFGQGERTIGLLKGSDEAFEGYTLYAPVGFNDSYVINNCGEVVNRFTSSYIPGLAAYLDQDANLIRTARVGNAILNGSGSGGGIERFNWNGDLEWSAVINTDSLGLHHDIHVMDNGNILAIAWDRLNREQAISLGYNAEQLGQELWVDSVIEIEPVGSSDFEIVWRWSAKDHLVQDTEEEAATYGDIIANPGKFDFGAHANLARDWLHMNSIYYIEDRDQILLSSRNFSEVLIIDHSTTTEEAKGSFGGNSGRGGEILFRWGNENNYLRNGQVQILDGQHNAEMNSEGIIQIYNNRPSNDEGAEIVRLHPDYDPDTFAYKFDQGYLLKGPQEYLLRNVQKDIQSRFMSSAQSLENGNILVCKSDDADFLEYDIEGELVWHYRGPVVPIVGPSDQGTTNRGQAFKAIRYPLDDSRFDGLDILVIADRIELDTMPISCDILSSAYELENNEEDFSYQWVSARVLRLSSSGTTMYSIVDLNGRAFVSGNLSEYPFAVDLDTASWPGGLYVISTISKDSNQSTKKIFVSSY